MLQWSPLQSQSAQHGVDAQNTCWRNKYARLKDSYKRQNSKCRLHCSSAEERFSRASRTNKSHTGVWYKMLQKPGIFSPKLFLLQWFSNTFDVSPRNKLQMVPNQWFSNCALRSPRALQKCLRVTRGRAPRDSRLKGGNRVSLPSAASTALVLTLFIYWGPPGLHFKNGT